jgi:Flp pilus assembly protein CpaB
MPIIAALIAGLAAILLLNLYVGGLQQSLRPSLTPVVVASHQLAAGAVLDAKD